MAAAVPRTVTGSSRSGSGSGAAGRVWAAASGSRAARALSRAKLGKACGMKVGVEK